MIVLDIRKLKHENSNEPSKKILEEILMNRDEIINYLRSFREKNHTKYNIIRIGIFGSAARDNMNEKSDIDIVVELEKPDFFNLIGIKQALEEQLHQSVDIVRYREKMNQYLKRRIDSEAVYV